jgi:hypothetical protein
MLPRGGMVRTNLSDRFVRYAKCKPGKDRTDYPDAIVP